MFVSILTTVRGLLFIKDCEFCDGTKDVGQVCVFCDSLLFVLLARLNGLFGVLFWHVRKLKEGWDANVTLGLLKVTFSMESGQHEWECGILTLEGW